MNKEDLIESIRTELRKQGVARIVQTQAKKEVCQMLLTGTKRHTIRSLEQAAIRSLIMDCLVCDQMDCTRTVFSSESGLDEYQLSMEDIFKTFEIQKGSKLWYGLFVDPGTTSKGPKCYKDSIVYQLLTKLPETVTHASNSTIQKSSQTVPLDLDRDSLVVPANTHQGNMTMEARMFVFQQECEEREKKRTEEELEKIKKSIRKSMELDFSQRCLKEVEATRKNMQIKADKNEAMMKSREEQLKKDFLVKQREMEYEHSAAKQKLAKELEMMEKREQDNKNFIEIEKRKLKLEQQKVQHIKMSAEAKLEYAETKEKEIRASVANEFNRVRLAAKQTYDDASESVKKQSAFYAKELDELNGTLL